MVIWERSMHYENLIFKSAPKNKGQRTESTYADVICAFDIETTRFPDIEQSVMYVWQFAIGEKLVIMGRTWKEFLHMLKSIKKRLYGMKLLIYVHNLSFEFQFLSGIYNFTNNEVFATESRQILKASMFQNFEFRCSYRLFNLSLSAVTERFNCQYRKQSGAAFDYDKIRLPSTPLTHRELLYCVCDVLGLVEAIQHQMTLHGDSVYSIPYTQTGYVRREAKKLMRPHKWEIQDAYPDLQLYYLLRSAFRGGNTHANRYYTGDIINNVHGIDISSSYPAQQVLEQYPIGPFKECGCLSLSSKHMSRLIEQGRALVMEIEFYNIRLRYQYEPIPYIARAKCLNNPDKYSLLVDNGRLLDSNGLCVRLAVTDIDFHIIESQYCWDRMDIKRMYHAEYGPMYDGLKELNLKLFREKTMLKDVPGQELFYARSKEMLNGIYGMSCQNPLQPDLLYDDLLYNVDKSRTDGELLKAAKKNAFLTYQLGVWTTAHARHELQRVIDMHKDFVIYCDTDSIMFTGEIKGLNEFNDSYIARDMQEGGFAQDPSGKMHYLGVFENEDDSRTGYKFTRFCTQGSKKYAFEKLDKKGNSYVGITVAGVPKIEGGKELERKGGLKSFKPGFVFSESGKLCSIYNDENYGDYMVNGEKVEITRNITLSPTTYALDWTKDYTSLINSLSESKLFRIVQDVEY